MQLWMRHAAHGGGGRKSVKSVDKIYEHMEE